MTYVVKRELEEVLLKKKANIPLSDVGMPQEIYEISKGELEGNEQAEMVKYNDFGTALGEALSIIITLFDGIVILGGGVSGAFDIFAPAMFEQIESNFKLHDGNFLHRLVPRVFNLEDSISKSRSLEGQQKEIDIPETNKKIAYDPFL